MLDWLEPPRCSDASYCDPQHHPPLAHDACFFALHQQRQPAPLIPHTPRNAAGRQLEDLTHDMDSSSLKPPVQYESRQIRKIAARPSCKVEISTTNHLCSSEVDTSSMATLSTAAATSSSSDSNSTSMQQQQQFHEQLQSIDQILDQQDNEQISENADGKVLSVAYHSHVDIQPTLKTFNADKCKRKRVMKKEENQEATDSGRTLYVPGSTLKCPESACNTLFETHADFKQHMHGEHAQTRPYRCHKCAKGFAKGTQLNKHMKQLHLPKPFECSQCDKQFAYASELDEHITRAHDKQKRFECGECGRGFYCDANLKAHLRRHTGEKPFACEHCAKAFTRKGDLKKHLRTHTGEKPFQCAKCNKAFSQNSSRNQHQKKCQG